MIWVPIQIRPLILNRVPLYDTLIKNLIEKINGRYLLRTPGIWTSRVHTSGVGVGLAAFGSDAADIRCCPLLGLVLCDDDSYVVDGDLVRLSGAPVDVLEPRRPPGLLGWFTWHDTSRKQLSAALFYDGTHVERIANSLQESYGYVTHLNPLVHPFMLTATPIYYLGHGLVRWVCFVPT